MTSRLAGEVAFFLWGHQITFRLRPDEVLAPDQQGKRHFGVVLPWAEWEALAPEPFVICS
jgi:extradiol dioxygenase family protein